MDYTQISQKTIEERDSVCESPKLGESVSKTKAKEDIGYFTYHQLGMKPYAWQYQAFKQFRNSPKHQLWCTPRQYMGKSTALAIIALHSCIYNLYPIESKGNKTIIGIVSRSDEQSKKLVADIKTMMWKGDDHVERITGGKVKNFFTQYLSSAQDYAQTKSEMTFVEPRTGKVIGQIICLPPTDRVRGYTFSHLLMDEVAFFEDDEFFLTIAAPTLNITKGKMVMTTTPNGQRGFFFKVFDPFDIEPTNDFDRIWLNWEHIEIDDFRQKVIETRDLYYVTGKAKKFEQEYEAKFTAAVNNYFDPEKVDDAMDKELQKWNSYDKPTDMGIDFGMVNSRTVITISRYCDDDVIRLIYHYIYPYGTDNSLVLDVKELVKRFNVQRVIVDNCPEGYHFIQLMKEEGLNLKEMTFRKEKVAKYGQFRAKLYSGKIKFYRFEELSAEMKAMEEEETVRSTRISKPSGGTDDIVDSFVMSVYYFIEDNNKLKFYDWDGLYKEDD